jgi:hypothetical protein
VQDWAEIRRLHLVEGLPIRKIARVLGISRNTVRAALAADGPNRYERRPAGSVVDAVEPQIRDLLAADPQLPASVIARRIGWERGMTVLRQRVALLRPAYLPVESPTATVSAAGQTAYCDLWLPEVEIPVGSAPGTKPMPVLVMVCAQSRWLSAQMIASRAAEDLFTGWWRLLSALGACPRTFVWDEESAIGRWRRGVTELTEQCEAFRDALAADVVVRRGGNAAGSLTDQARGELQVGFLPGRRFGSPADFNHQLGEWLVADNGRTRRALGFAPADRIAGDRAAMLPLPRTWPHSTAGSDTSSRPVIGL